MSARARSLEVAGAADGRGVELGAARATGELLEVVLTELVERVSARERLALKPADAAAALSISRDAFDEHVLPELRVVRRGRLVLVPVRELERWLERQAAVSLEVDTR